MDTSETYISMCREAKELQKLRGDEKWQNGDVYSCITSRGPFTSWWTDTEDEPPQMFRPVWLPRQDQLQDMLEGSFMEKLAGFWEAVVEGRLVFNTWEQAWLSQVMRVKFHKTWDDKHWLKFDVEG